MLAAPFLPEHLSADLAESQPGRAHARTHTLTHTHSLSHRPRRLPGDPVADHRSNPVAQPRVLQSRSDHTISRWWVLGQQTQKASTCVSFTLTLLPALPAPLACSRSRSHARARTHMHGYTHLGLNVRNGSGVQRAFILRCMPQTRLRKRDGTAHAAQRKRLGAPTGEEPRDAWILQLLLHPLPQQCEKSSVHIGSPLCYWHKPCR